MFLLNLAYKMTVLKRSRLLNMFIKTDVEISFLLFCGFVLLEVLELLSGFLYAVLDRNCSFGFEDFDGLGSSLALVVFIRGLP